MWRCCSCEYGLCFDASSPGARLHAELLHDPLHADEPTTEARLRAVLPGQDLLEVRDARPAILRDEQEPHRRPASELDVDLAARGVRDDVARELADRRRHALRIEGAR